MSSLKSNPSTATPDSGYMSNISKGVYIPTLVVCGTLLFAGLLIVWDWKRRRKKNDLGERDSQMRIMQQLLMDNIIDMRTRNPSSQSRSMGRNDELPLFYARRSDAGASEQSQETRILLDNSEVEEEEVGIPIDEVVGASNSLMGCAEHLQQRVLVGDPAVGSTCGTEEDGGQAFVDDKDQSPMADCPEGAMPEEGDSGARKPIQGEGKLPEIRIQDPSEVVRQVGLPRAIGNVDSLEGGDSGRLQREASTDPTDGGMAAAAAGAGSAHNENSGSQWVLEASVLKTTTMKVFWHIHVDERPNGNDSSKTGTKKQRQPTMRPVQEQTPANARRSPQPWTVQLDPDMQISLRVYDGDSDSLSSAGPEESTRGDPVSARLERLGIERPTGGPHSTVQLELGSDSDSARSRHSSSSRSEDGSAASGASES